MVNNMVKNDTGKIVGIDLGTTNSAIAYMTIMGPKPILNGHLNTMPSVVSWIKDGGIYVGEQAKAQALMYPKTTVRSIKRCMGMKDLSKCEQLPEKIFGIKYAPEEISAIILTKLIKNAEASIGKITKVVVSIPAYFRDGERRATKAAAMIAGFEEKNIAIVEEPNAAALSYAMENPDIYDSKILVFDLGGGTFDVTILEIIKKEKMEKDRICNAIYNGGERKLGGDDFDQKIIDYLVREFKNEHGIDLNKYDAAIQAIKTEAELAKIRLSNETIDQTDIIINRVVQDLNIEKALTRDKFNELTKDLVDKAKYITEKTLIDGKINKKDIDKIIMVGGSSRIIAVQNVVKDIFPGKNIGTDIFIYEPDLAIAKGAAIYASLIFDNGKDLGIGSGGTVTTHGLGIAAEIDGVKDVFSMIIEKGTPRPARNTDTYFTSKDGQTTADIEIYEGESSVAKENELWDRFTVTDIPSGPKGKERIDVTFKYASDNILTVEVKVVSTGKVTKKGLTSSQISGNELVAKRENISKQIKLLR